LGGNDIIEGRGSSDWVSGNPGDEEIIFGWEGYDFLKGGGGKDELDGESRADVCVEREKVRACEQ
jgi:Ca2+-binding RTX toxin-like protein